MKILYVVPPSHHFAGMERVVHDLASGLAVQYPGQLDVTVLYCHRYPELSGDLPYKVIWERVEQLRSFGFRVARWLRKKNYDVVVVAQFEPAALLWLSHRLGGGRARFIMHFHGNPKVEGTGSLRARMAFSLFGTIVRRMDKVIAVSPSLASYIDSRVGEPGLVEYLPNPVRQFQPSPRAIAKEGLVSFISIGRLARQKGHDILIDAFAKVLATCHGARLVIVGDGQEFGALDAQIDRLGIRDHVLLAGKISNPEAELASADCFVSASRWEGFGVAIVEAMSAGLPVIATDCDFGPRDLIDSPEKGWIVPVGDIDALAAAMSAFAQQDRSNAHHDVRRKAAAMFNLDNVVAQHAAMLEATGLQTGGQRNGRAFYKPTKPPK
ncbi:MAG: hypothetical protein JWL66_1627 [Sphingomonadales bacterium]|nr:hypothetical protein [Sphingomonadales bacterium]